MSEVNVGTIENNVFNRLPSNPEPGKIPGVWINYREKSTIAVYMEPKEGVCIGHFADTTSGKPCDSALTIGVDSVIRVQSVDADGKVKIRDISPARAASLFRQFFASVKDAAELE